MEMLIIFKALGFTFSIRGSHAAPARHLLLLLRDFLIGFSQTVGFH